MQREAYIQTCKTDVRTGLQATPGRGLQGWFSGTALGDCVPDPLVIPPIVGGRPAVPQAHKGYQLRGHLAQAFHERRAARMVECTDPVKGNDGGLRVELCGGPQKASQRVGPCPGLQRKLERESGVSKGGRKLTRKCLGEKTAKNVSCCNATPPCGF